ncbi:MULTISPECIES: alpha-L-rhamnosidase N-terminal domain-containing protein [Streptomyces]|uniref:alpha-L-rhamnosidase N-terminal domain-containing protein n=1 Tax=Streptomyces TaxID=1883 RepID=UPI00148837DB|nr:alpha-L-rhamnosidase N-terminal domain-containing protein [Streptomyces sp. Z423-1]
MSSASPAGHDEPWQGHWIGAQPAPVPGVDDVSSGTGGRRGFSRVLFRKELHLSAVPTSAPVRAQPRRWRYEAFDVVRHLRRGPNVIAVLASYYGRATSWWQSAPPEGGINSDACLVLDARWDGAGDLSSDVSWRVHRSTAWSMLGSFGVPCEVLDARALPTGWTGPGLDDSGWPTATILKARHWGGLGRSRPPVSPYGKLLPRPIAVLGGPTVRPTAVLDARIRPKPHWASPHPAARVVQYLEDPGTPVRTGLPLSASIDRDQRLDVILDFGALTTGFVELTVDASPGTVLELGHREKPKRVGVTETTSDYEAGARYTARAAGRPTPPWNRPACATST